MRLAELRKAGTVAVIILPDSQPACRQLLPASLCLRCSLPHCPLSHQPTTASECSQRLWLAHQSPSIRYLSNTATPASQLQQAGPVAASVVVR